MPIIQPLKKSTSPDNFLFIFMTFWNIFFVLFFVFLSSLGVTKDVIIDSPFRAIFYVGVIIIIYCQWELIKDFKKNIHY